MGLNNEGIVWQDDIGTFWPSYVGHSAFRSSDRCLELEQGFIFA